MHPFIPSATSQLAEALNSDLEVGFEKAFSEFMMSEKEVLKVGPLFPRLELA
jgi:methionyl-tRNA synthetase